MKLIADDVMQPDYIRGYENTAQYSTVQYSTVQWRGLCEMQGQQWSHGDGSCASNDSPRSRAAIDLLESHVDPVSNYHSFWLSEEDF